MDRDIVAELLTWKMTQSRQLLRDRRARALPCAVANRRGIGLSVGLRA